MSNYQVPKGYKQTEVGVIPEDWEVYSVGQMGEVVTGKALAVNAPGQQRPYLRTKNVFDGQIDIEDVLTMPMTDAQFEHFMVLNGDVLLNEGQTLELVGRCAIYQDEYPEPCAMQNQLIRFRAKKGVSSILASHLSRFCQKTGVFSKIALQTTSVAHLGSKRFENLLLPWPKTEKEQGAIATALSDVDALIAALDKLIAKKRHLKTATMQQLLTGKKRLPGFGEGKGYKQTEVGTIPADWDVVYLGDIGQSLIGLTYSPEDIRDFGTLVLRSSNVQNERLAYEDNVYVDSELPLPSRVVVEKGDILICVRNGSRQLIGKCALIDEKAAGSAFGAFMSVFRTKLSGFVFYQFQSDIIQTQINEIMGATINQITSKDLVSFQIPLPPTEEEQRAIATVLSDMDAEISALETRRAKTQAIKQGMMQELLTGRTRLV